MRHFLLNSLGWLDFVCWLMVVTFFCSCSLLFAGDLEKTIWAACGVILTMILISLAIEAVIATLSNIRGIGTITGLITNGPELVCLVAGLAAGNLWFAASTPLGSNFVNPLLLLVAALVCSSFDKTVASCWKYLFGCLFFTSFLAGSFYGIQDRYYPYWLAAATVITGFLFVVRPREDESLSQDDVVLSGWVLAPAIAVLVSAGSFLDPVVSYASVQSHVPKGVIGFIVLATLSSWPEFKCCTALLGRGKYRSAVLNITVSNITNIWLAVAGILAYLLF